MAAKRKKKRASKRPVFGEPRHGPKVAKFAGAQIYAVQSGRTGPIKIAFTSKPARARIAEMQAGNPEVLVLLGAWPGDEAQAERIAKRFRRLVFRGQWFHPVVEVTEYVDYRAAGHDEGERLSGAEVVSARQVPLFDPGPTTPTS